MDWDVMVGSELGNADVGREVVSGCEEGEPGSGAVECREDVYSRLGEGDSGVVSELGEVVSGVVSGVMEMDSETVSGLGDMETELITLSQNSVKAKATTGKKNQTNQDVDVYL